LTESKAVGAGLAIVVNANAKRGGRRIAVQISRALPGARVRLTKTPEELRAWLGTLEDPRCVLAAGGDGSAVALVNALHQVTPKDEPLPLVGILPLGTGNAWAHSVGSRKLGECVKALQRMQGPLPGRRFGLLEIEGRLTFLAGCGWDAQILNDYRAQLESSPSKTISKSVWGYLSAMLFRTVPKQLVMGRPHVIVENFGDVVYVMSPDRKLTRAEGIGRGTILYEGMASVASAATVPEYGYGFRAFPFAERLPGFMNVRVYDQKPLRAVSDIPDLWRGRYPLRGMHDWFATHVRMTFSRPMPLQIGGDAVGERQTIEMKSSDRTVDILEWRRCFFP
jgi:diacylglycerol kinase family enzyme